MTKQATQRAERLAPGGIPRYMRVYDNGGETIDREANDAWLASDRGKAFLHACAGSWARAHTAAGEGSQVAKAMAARTASFYAGE